MADSFRAQLAQPEGEGLTGEEWDDLVGRAWDKYETIGHLGEQFMYDSDFGNALDFVRKELARRPTPQPPADGEVEDLVAKLRRLAPQNPLGNADPTITRAAELLQRQHPQPVPVAERPWEREGWCDDEGRCWLQGKIEGDWRLINPRKSGLPQLKYAFSRSLPAHALPVPTSEGPSDAS